MNQRIRAQRPEPVTVAARSHEHSAPMPRSLRAMRAADLALVQATAGNRAARSAVQREMQVGAANDPHEHEADAVAREIVNATTQREATDMDASDVDDAPADETATDMDLDSDSAQASHVHRVGLEEEELQMKPLLRVGLEEEELQMKPLQRVGLEEEELLQGAFVARDAEGDAEGEAEGGWEHEAESEAEGEAEAEAKHIERDVAPEVGMAGGAASADTTAAVEGARGGGRPLGDGVRSEMEGAFGADFSGVRIHDGAEAADLNDRISARAFTTGSDIFIGREGLNTGSRGGKELLAHELTHVVQQGAAGRKPRRS
jgi:hypothetical protein